jgi:hypothetical protein
MCFSRIVFGLLLGSLAAIGAKAQADEPPARVDLVYVSRSVFRGVERAGDSLQAEVELSRDNLRGGFGTHQPFGGDSARDFNAHAGYRWSLTEGVTLEASLAHTWFNEVPGGGVKRSLEAGLAATLMPVKGFTPSLRYYHDFYFCADTAEAALAHSTALPKLGAFLEWNFVAGYVAGDDWRPAAGGPRRRDDYSYWGGEASLPYRIGANTVVVAGLHYIEASGRSPTNGPFGRSGGARLWISLGVTRDF